ncbi:MAG: hypothetical protein SGBAC_007948 [Bacillariaceae sp.]
MSDPKCYLCDKPGKFEKLFRKCKHESACFGCLRNSFVLDAKHVCKYPLECFHPDCNLRLRNTQMERFVKSKEELQTYYDLNAKATKRQDILEILREALGNTEICRCPKCKLLITKNGGCDHMTCICGTAFNWSDAIAETITERPTRNVRSVDVPALCKKNKQKGAPVLQVDEHIFADCDSYSDPDQESVHPPHEDLKAETKRCTPIGDLAPTSDLESVPPELDSFPFLSREARETAAVSVAPSDISVGTKTEWEQDFEILELVSNQSDNSWTQLECQGDSETGINMATDGFQTTSSQTTWEEVSEISSIVSFHSKTGMSFLEAARAASTQSKSSSHRNTQWKEFTRVPKPMSHLNTTIIAEHTTSKSVVPIHDDQDLEDETLCNADFIYHGSKDIRGGKKKFMFHHQPRRKYRGSKRRFLMK